MNQTKRALLFAVVALLVALPTIAFAAGPGFGFMHQGWGPRDPMMGQQQSVCASGFAR